MFETLERMLINYNWQINKCLKTTKMRKGQYSVNVGLTCHWAKPGKPMLPTRAMIENDAEIYNECKMLFPDLEFDCIMINKNFTCPPHKDKNNTGDSVIIGFGDYMGGELVIEGEPVDIYYTPYMFNGSKKEHWVTPFVGDRYSVVLCKSKFMAMVKSELKPVVLPSE
tara:strand:+ start:378 stop:881 length:504 start_codon:yes stop_codon:yes gene_type:complete